MDKKEIDELNYLINYINHAQEADDTFMRTLTAISNTTNAEKLLYIMSNCKDFLTIVKQNEQLTKNICNTISNADSKILFNYIKYPNILNFNNKVSQIICKKVLCDNNLDNNYIADLLITNNCKIGKVLFEKLYSLVNLQTQINLVLYKKQLSGEHPTLDMLNSLSNLAYNNKDFELALKLLDLHNNLYNNISNTQNQKVLQAIPDNSALQTINSASNYLYFVMQNSVNISNYKQALIFCKKLTELNINPVNFYYGLVSLQVSPENINDYKDLLLQLADLNLQGDTYKLLEKNFCKYITDPTKYVKMFDNPSADHEKLLIGFHAITKINSINDYFASALLIAKKTHECKYLQSQIFATCCNPKLIKEYISTCNSEDLSYLKSLQNHNKFLQKVLDKGDYLILEQSISQPETLF